MITRNDEILNGFKWAVNAYQKILDNSNSKENEKNEARVAISRIFDSNEITANELNTIGEMYHNASEGITRDYEKAKKWFEKSCTKGWGLAHYNLGVMYQHAHGVEKDLAMAAEYYRAACKKGFALAKEQLDKLPFSGLKTSCSWSSVNIIRDFFDRMYDVGQFLESYGNRDGTFDLRLNLNAVSPAGLEYIAIFLQNSNWPENLTWNLELPNHPVSQFATNIFLTMNNKYRKIIITQPTNCQLFNTTLQTNTYLSFLNQYHAWGGEKYYIFLNNKELLFQALQDLRQTMENGNIVEQALIYEFFAVHLLCQIPDGINSLEKLKDALKKGNDDKDLVKFKQEIIALLSSDTDAVQRLLNIQEPELKDKPEQNNTPATSQSLSAQTKARALTVLKAKAFWGRIAFYQINSNSADGVYWYGRYLHEFNHHNLLLAADSISMSTSYIPVLNSRGQAYREVIETEFTSHLGHFTHAEYRPFERIGLYWVRLAAVYCKSRSAHDYLQDLIQNQRPLFPPSLYQLMLGCEQLNIPQEKGSQFTQHSNLLALLNNPEFFSLKYHDVKP